MPGVTLDALEVGVADEPEFGPILDGAAVEILRGPQGGDMVGLRLRVTGDRPPACLYQRTDVSQRNADGLVAGSVASALNTYEESARVRTTRPTYVILDGFPISGQSATIAVSCGGKRVERTVRLER
jgi:hypothetical protein